MTVSHRFDEPKSTMHTNFENQYIELIKYNARPISAQGPHEGLARKVFLNFAEV